MALIPLLLRADLPKAGALGLSGHMEDELARAVVTELYRGILKREPDPGGLEHHTATLLADGSPARLAELMREFTRSAEAQALDAKLRGIHCAARQSPLGPIQHVISLGTDCYVSFLLKLAGWKRASYPFDWILSTPAMVTEIIRDDFVEFLNPAQHQSIPMERRRSEFERCANHLDYRERFGVDAIFMHRDITAPAHRNYYRRTVDRFRSVMASDDTKLLFMTNSDVRHASEKDFAELCEAIDGRYPNTKLLVVNVERAPGDNVALIGGSLERQIGLHEMIRYRATSPLNGVTFTNWIDDINMRGMVAQYEKGLD